MKLSEYNQLNHKASVDKSNEPQKSAEILVLIIAVNL